MHTYKAGDGLKQWGQVFTYCVLISTYIHLCAHKIYVIKHIFLNKQKTNLSTRLIPEDVVSQLNIQSQTGSPVKATIFLRVARSAHYYLITYGVAGPRRAATHPISNFPFIDIDSERTPRICFCSKIIFGTRYTIWKGSMWQGDKLEGRKVLTLK